MRLTFVELFRKSRYLKKCKIPRVNQVHFLGTCPGLGTKEKRHECTSSRGTDSGIIKSSYPDVDIPDVPVHQLIFQNLHLWEGKTAVECGLSGKKLTYKGLYNMSKALANSMLKKFKLEKGERFAVVLPNCPEYLVVLLAASMSGIVATTINPAYTPVEISIQLKDTDARMVITAAETYGKCLEALNLLKKKIPTVVAKIDEDSNIPQGSVSFEDVADPALAEYFDATAIEPKNDLFVLPYSSGTSGLPKGVELTHRNVVANLLQYRMIHEMKSDPDRGTGQCSILGVLPMFHIYGMVIIALDTVCEGDRLVSLPKFEPHLFIDTVFKEKINILYLVPPLVFFLSNSDLAKAEHLAHVQHIVTGAAPCGGTDLDKLMDKAKHLQIAQGYGMTETSPVITASHKARRDKLSSVGHPLPSTMIKVADLNSGRPLPSGERGQISVKGPQVMKGYFNRSEETKATFDDDGWLKTGDIGYYDKDHDFFIVDRMKELIKVKGFQVAPAELEEFLRNHPKIADVGVIGVPHPHHGEVPKAFVVLKNGVSCTEDEIKNYVRGNLSAHKELVGGVEFLENIPKSGAGKILRRNLKLLNEKKTRS